MMGRSPDARGQGNRWTDRVLLPGHEGTPYSGRAAARARAAGLQARKSLEDFSFEHQAGLKHFELQMAVAQPCTVESKALAKFHDLQSGLVTPGRNGPPAKAWLWARRVNGDRLLPHVIRFGKGVDLATPLEYVERNYQRRRGVNRDQ